MSSIPNGWKRSMKRYNRSRRNRKKPAIQKQLNTIKKKIKKEPWINVPPAVAGTLNDTPVIVHVDPAQALGSSSGNVTGNSALWRSIRIKGWFKSVGAVNAPCRLDVILDKRPKKGTLATWAEIYAPDPPTVNAFVHPDYIKRFKILASVICAVNTNDGQVFFFDRYIKLNRKIYGTGSWTQANQESNAILIAHWTDSDGNEPTYSYSLHHVLIDDN